MGFDWKATLAAVAPMIGSAIGGPFGALAGTAIKAVLGLGEDADESAMAKALSSATPEQLLALRNADNQFKLDLQKIGVDLAKIDADDRASARQREMTVLDWTPKALAVGLTLGFFGLLGWMMHQAPPEGSATVLNIMIGSLGTGWVQMLAYYFGSSAGAARKDALLLNSTPNAGGK